MGFYDLTKGERVELVKRIREEIKRDLETGKSDNIRKYGSDEDTYIRKNAYLALGRLYLSRQDWREDILNLLEVLYRDRDAKIRQTVVYTLGEIGKVNAKQVVGMLESALYDPDHSVKNAIVGALKRMGEKNPEPTLKFAKKFLHHTDPEVRRLVVHGIELRGRTHPEDVLPLLEELEDDPDRRVRKKIIHVLSQISYKEGCLEKVVSALKNWKNKTLIEKALHTVLEVHKRYQFSAQSYEDAKEFLAQNFKNDFKAQDDQELEAD